LLPWTFDEVEVRMHALLSLPAFGFLAVVAVSDYRQRRISNRLNLCALLAALLLRLADGGVGGLVAGSAGLIAGFVVLLLPFLAGMVGGGDVKFAAAAGAFLGWRLLLAGLAVGVLLGGVVGAISLARRGRFRVALRGLCADIYCLAHGVRPKTLGAAEAVETVPYGVLLALGMAATLTVAIVEEVSWLSQ